MTCNVYLLCKYYHLRSWDRLKILFFLLMFCCFSSTNLVSNLKKNTKIKFPCQKKKILFCLIFKNRFDPKFQHTGIISEKLNDERELLPFDKEKPHSRSTEITICNILYSTCICYNSSL